MATIDRTGITNGSVLDASHITNIIDALDGTNISTDVILGNTQITGSLNVTAGITGSILGTATTASYVLQAVSSSFATTASYALNAAGGSGFPYTGSALISGSLEVTTGLLRVSGSAVITGSLLVRGSTTLTGSGITIVGETDSTNWVGRKDAILNWAEAGGSPNYNGQFVLPLQAPTSPLIGSVYFDAASSTLWIWNGSAWVREALTP